MKKAIVVASFGTTFPGIKVKITDIIEKRYIKRFYDFHIYQAYTSEMIIEQIKIKKGIEILNIPGILEKLSKSEYGHVFIQPLHIIQGKEYEKIVDQVEIYKERFDTIKIGKPLLTDLSDFIDLKKILIKRVEGYKKGEGLVLMGHGSLNKEIMAYTYLDTILKAEPIFICTMESCPSIEMLIEKLHNCNINKVNIAPLLLVSGKHVKKDMISKEKYSLKSRLEDEEFIVDVNLKGLGEYDEIQEIYIQHTQRLLLENRSR
ncbi:MAG: sirohydrochlorin cobaltochelatase [Miniphocaeibacter sp.]|uniref:sirohydrochlorin cobaltochelatase n=1 Tax=Miniphocaeibacter sp. TaxID=3100973 RepID=UPI001840C116|nr:sirohydrochlorin cobaltochelatase [Gallicola sp.]